MRGRLYDMTAAVMDAGGFRRTRRRWVAHARGRVLEIGAGTGRNVDLYPADGSVTSVDLTEPDRSMRRRLERRVAAHHGAPAMAVAASTAEGPFPCPPYDTIVTTLVLCTVPDPEAAMKAMLDALAADGRIVYVEHVRAVTRAGRAVQRTLDPLWARVADGCHLTRDTGGLLRAADLVPIDKEVLHMPPPLFLGHAGVAIRKVRP